MSTSLSPERRLVRALYEAATHARVAGLPGMAEDLDRHRSTAEAYVVAQEAEQRVPELEGDGLRRLLRMPPGTHLVLTVGDLGPRPVELEHARADGGQVVVDLIDRETGCGYTLRRPHPDGPLTITGPLLAVSGSRAASTARGEGNPHVRTYVPQGPYRPAGPGGAGRW